MGDAFAQVALHQYRRDRPELFQISSLSEQNHLAASFVATNGSCDGSSGVRSGEEDVEILVMEADDEVWDLEGVMTSEADYGVEGNGSYWISEKPSMIPTSRINYYWKPGTVEPTEYIV